MYEFHDGGKFVVPCSLVPAGTCRKQNQRRAHSLAARGYDVFGNLSDKDYLRMQTGSHDGIDGTHVGGNRGIQAGNIHGRFCRQGKGAMLGGATGIVNAVRYPAIRCVETTADIPRHASGTRSAISAGSVRGDFPYTGISRAAHLHLDFPALLPTFSPLTEILATQIALADQP